MPILTRKPCDFLVQDLADAYYAYYVYVHFYGNVYVCVCVVCQCMSKVSVFVYVRACARVFCISV